MKFTSTTVIPFAPEQIDLEEWLFAMSDKEYQATAPQHRALGTFVENGVRGMVNVEVMGHALLVQHYHLVRAQPSYIELFSERSSAYLMHVVPVPVPVRWTMSIARENGERSVFSCSVEPQMGPTLHALARATGVVYAIRKHTVVETTGFAADITRKLQSGTTVSPGP